MVRRLLVFRVNPWRPRRTRRSAVRALRPVPVSTPAAIPEPLPAPPVLDLPPFPILDVADIGVEFTFDQSGFPEGVDP